MLQTVWSILPQELSCFNKTSLLNVTICFIWHTRNIWFVQPIVTMSNLKCDICGKVYVRQKHLTNHLQYAHGGSKSFQCTQCKKSFVSLKNLTRHMQIGSCKAPKQVSIYACHFCHDSFKSMNQLRLHFKEKHKSDSKKIKKPKKKKQSTITDYYDNDEELAMQRIDRKSVV